MPTTWDLRPLHRRALDLAEPLVGRIRRADLARPTPCDDWDLRALLGHVIGQNHGFAQAVETAEAPRSAYAARPTDSERVTDAWQASADRVVDAFAAAPSDRQVRLVEISEGARFPVATVVGFHLVDTVAHTWDIATALGETFRPDVELVDTTLALARQVPDGSARTRPGAAFAPVRPVTDSDDWATALALLGRG